MSAEVEAFKSLGPFVVLQAAVGLLIIGAAIFAGIWALRGKIPPPANGAGILPQWTLYGPVGDVIKAIHDMAEQSREGNKTLHEIKRLCDDIRKEQREGTMLLEDIRNNQAMRGDITIPPTRGRKSL